MERDNVVIGGDPRVFPRRTYFSAVFIEQVFLVEFLITIDIVFRF